MYTVEVPRGHERALEIGEPWVLSNGGPLLLLDATEITIQHIRVGFLRHTTQNLFAFISDAPRMKKTRRPLSATQASSGTS